MIPFLALLLLAEPRDAKALLREHGVALGAFDRVAALASKSVLDDRQGTRVPGVVARYRLPGECMRRFPTNRFESFGPEGAFVYQGSFERYRPGQATTRAGYLLLEALANPVPLRAALLDDAIARRMKVAEAEGHEVLVLPEDAYGMQRMWLLDRTTHLLANYRVGAPGEEAIVNVSYGDYRDVGGVMLPHQIVAAAILTLEDADEKRFRTARTSRFEQFESWTVEEAPKEAFSPGGVAPFESDRFERALFATGPEPQAIAAGDLDGDGRKDLAVACFGGLSVHFGGAESAPVFVPLGKARHGAVAVADMDLDGRDEALVHSNLHPAQTLFRVAFTADRKPLPAERSTVQTHFCSRMAVGDLDFDGLPDLLLSGFASRNLVIRFGNGCGGFRITGSHWPLAEKGPDRRGFGVAVGRADPDPLHDLAVADGERVLLLQGNDRLGFVPTGAMEAGPRPTDVAFADLDGDGRDDLVVLNDHPFEDLPLELRILMNTGKGFQERMQIDGGARATALATGDLDGDGDIDLATAASLSGDLRVRWNEGGGRFAARDERLPSGRGAGAILAADLDGDGRCDLAAANRLDDTIALFRNRTGKALPAPASRWARVAPPPNRVEFRLEGLADPYRFEGEFELPDDLPEPSGVAFFSGDGVHSQLLLVSDEVSALWRATLDRAGRRLLVSRPIPLGGLERESLDLEGIAVDRDTGTLFLACERDNSVLWATAFGRVLARAPTRIESGANDGTEAIAFRRKKDGTPRLYLFRERIGTSLKRPPVRVFEPSTEPEFRLTPLLDTELPFPTPDQTDACCDGERLLVACRFLREIAEFGFDGDGFAPEPKHANYRTLVDGLLGLFDARMPLFGNVEGVARDLATGDLFLAVDNNGQEVGNEGRNRSRRGRLLWFSNAGASAPEARPVRVGIRQLLVAFKGAGAPGRPAAVTERTREEAARLAARLESEARGGADFAALARKHNDGGTLFPPEMRVVEGAGDRIPGEMRSTELPRALARAAFELAVGEIFLVEHHEEESPFGWHLILRTE